ncbi:MAG: CBU_0592 family membrane protein, partial [Stellaceae bacterium]
ADWRFAGANLLGSCLILVSFLDRWNLPSFVINLCWAAISVLGLIKGARARARGNGEGS